MGKLPADFELIHEGLGQHPHNCSRLPSSQAPLERAGGDCRIAIDQDPSDFVVQEPSSDPAGARARTTPMRLRTGPTRRRRARQIKAPRQSAPDNVSAPPVMAVPRRSPSTTWSSIIRRTSPDNPETVRQAVERIHTQTGLRVKARILDKVCEIGRSCSDTFRGIKDQFIRHDPVLGQ
ncbi:hypothetical protein [Thiococcus pfennigii]|uniref:hypothetical protein n=1 Tax=Thiococcus pfennigii TaxID=1057 RepID=UPI00190503ED|nr:hypothetical protein [Thiococcus pfennigii]